MAVQSPRPHPAKGYLVLAGISQAALAERLECSAIWVSRVLGGHERPPARFRRVVCELLGRPEDLLFNAPDEGRYPDFEPTEAAS